MSNYNMNLSDNADSSDSQSAMKESSSLNVSFDGSNKDNSKFCRCTGVLGTDQ